MNSKVYYKTEIVNGIEIFYREAGILNTSTFVLFHGFPSAGHMFRELIPMLAEKYHVVAPDYPGFGNSGIPDRSSFHYTFEHISEMMEAFLMKQNICNFSMYVFDYGAPIGFRIAQRHSEWITGIVSQNGNIYQEGLGKNGVSVYV